MIGVVGLLVCSIECVARLLQLKYTLVGVLEGGTKSTFDFSDMAAPLRDVRVQMALVW